MSGRASITVTTQGEEQTVALGEALSRLLYPGDVVAVHGELGAGKTRLVRGIAAGLGHDPGRVSSPTFVLMNEYDDAGARMPLVHVDAYRVRGTEELENAGWDRVMAGDAVVVVEWAERVAAALPAKRFEVSIEHLEGDARRVRIESPSASRGLEGLRGAPKACRICGVMVSPEAGTFPFCSARCRQIDLGKWATEDYRITRELKERDLEEGV